MYPHPQALKCAVVWLSMNGVDCMMCHCVYFLVLSYCWKHVTEIRSYV